MRGAPLPWLAFLIVLLAGGAASAGSVAESFGVDPGWTGVSNRSDGSDFGHSTATANAGGVAGEAGGVFTRSGTTSYYADTTIGGTLTASEAIAANGRFDITAITNWNAGVVIGYFDPAGASELGILILEETATSVRVMARVVFADGTVTQTAAAVLTGLNVNRVFTIAYDPAAGASASGRLEVSISGAGGISASLDLTATDRARGATLTAFGFKAGAAPDPNTALTASIFVDDLVYTVAGGRSFRSEVAADTPYAYWPFDETSGSTAADASGNGRSATYNGAVTRTATGLVRDAGSAIGFPTSSDFVQGTSNLIGTGAFTIEMVIRAGPQQSGVIFWENETQVNVAGAGAIRARFYDTGGTTAANQFIVMSPPLLEGWRHVAFVHTGTAVLLYVDGASVGTLATSGLPSRTGGTYVGRDESPGNFTGLVDEVAVYRSALPADRILAHYQAALVKITTFFGEDLNPSATARLASAPTSTAAKAAFQVAAAASFALGTQDFEGFAVTTGASLQASSFGLAFGALPLTATASRVPLVAPDSSFAVQRLEGTGTLFGTYPISGAQYLITNTGHEIAFSAAVNAVGFYFSDVEVARLSIELYRDATLIGSSAVPATILTPDGSAGFFGVVSGAEFNRVVFQGSSGSDGFAFDDVTVGMARVRFWGGPNGGSWATPGNWSPSAVPVSGDYVSMSAGSGPSVIGSGVTIRTLRLPAGFASAVTVNALLTIEEDLVVTSGVLNVGSGSLAVTGSVTLNGGVLKGSISGPGGPVTVTAGGSLRGSVTVGRTVVVGAGGRISPGE